MKKKCFVSLLMIIALLSITLTGCSNSSTKAGKKLILNEVAHSIFYAPMYVAIENGYFSEEGLDIELVTGFGADKTMTAVLSGEANIGFMGPESTIYTYLGGANDKVINFAQLTQRAGNFIVARDEEPNFKWEDLKGKTVLGGRAGGMPEMVFEYILLKNGIDPKTDLTIDQSIDFGSTAAAFSGGKGDYTVEFEPGATTLEQMNKGYHVVASLGIDSGYVPYTCFCAKESYVNSNRDEIQKFTNAMQKGLNYVNSHTANEIAQVIKPQFKETDNNILTTIVDRYQQQQTWKTDLIFEEESLDLLQNILMSADQISEKVSYTDLITTDFAKNALENED